MVLQLGNTQANADAGLTPTVAKRKAICFPPLQRGDIESLWNSPVRLLIIHGTKIDYTLRYSNT